MPPEIELLAIKSAPAGDVSLRLALEDVCRPGKLVDAPAIRPLLK
jgi:hypothetical protein